MATSVRITAEVVETDERGAETVKSRASASHIFSRRVVIECKAEVEDKESSISLRTR